MKVGLVFHKNPLAPQSGIDLIRLKAIAGGLIRQGIETDVLAPVRQEGFMSGTIPVHPLPHLAAGHYDILKTSYHFSMELIQNYHGPVVSRIVRVVDSRLPERDDNHRERLLRCQQYIRQRASVMVLNNVENQRRWELFYGNSPPVVLVPTGCPFKIPMPGKNPFEENRRIILFLGSLAAPRMVSMMNALAAGLDEAQIHFIGRDKTGLYGMKNGCHLHPSIVRHGEMPQDDIWDYIRYAAVGLALATGPHAFDNDLSKIYSYLRGGLPVLSESTVLNNDLIQQTGLGRVFSYGDTADLIAGALSLLNNPPDRKKREAAMTFMAGEHAWERRVDIYAKLFQEMTAST
jgi:glycosyltransferase involved in cell wall biosynthesis